MNTRVTIVGGGNLGLACAARMSSAGCLVTLWTSEPERWSTDISVVDCDGMVFAGRLSHVTADPVIAAEADMIYLCLPGNVICEKLSALAPLLSSGTPVVSVFSADGFFFVADEVLGEEWPVLGFQRVPFISRTRVPYKVGGITGYRKELLLAHRNVRNPEPWRQLFELSFGTPTRLLSNYLEAALANSNPIIHPSRIMSLRGLIERNGPFTRMPLFYEEWDDVASEYAIRLDTELCALAAAKGVRMQPFLSYYESTDVRSLTRKIRSISAFKGIGSPLLQTGELDYSSRYIKADIEISVRNIVRLSKELSLATPCADEILSISWGD